MSEHSDLDASDSRRGFFGKVLALALGAVSLLVPAAVGIFSFLNPLRQKGQGGEFFKLTSLDALPEDGLPQRFAVISDRVDAWNRFPDQAIGSVFLRRTGPAEVEALNVVCPHAGCFVEYNREANEFYCPCHKARFELDGAKIVPEGTSHPSPRPMDTLVWRIDNDTDVMVKFENFLTGTSNKVPEA